jgi:SH3-like domain-containing protein
MPDPAARIVLAALLLMPAAAGAELAKPATPPAHADATRPDATRPPATHPAANHPDPSHPDATHRVSTPVIRPRPAARHAAPAAKVPPAPAVTPAPVPEQPAEPGKGANSGLPLPRFAALRSDEVNLRSGPGTRYPIEWVYKRRDLPVKIEREFEIWRLVQDQEGVKGWVNQATLAPRRTAAVLGAAGTEHALRRDAQDGASPVARLKPGVIVRLRSCEAKSDWCQAQVGDYHGWIRRTELWGVSPDEVIQ